METKTRVKFIGTSQYDDWQEGDIGYVDGYVLGGDGIPCVCVVTGGKIVLAPTTSLQVITDSKTEATPHAQ